MEAAARFSKTSSRITCPACGMSNTAGSRFCGSCRGSLQGDATPPPPPPPPSHGRFDFGGGPMLGRSIDNQVTVALPVAAAYEQALNALRAAGAEIQWASPPQGARFVAKYRELGSTVRFHGTLTVTPMGPSQTTVEIDLKTDWGSVIPTTMITIVLIFLVGITLMPLLLIYAMPLSLLTVIYMAWWAASWAPRKVVGKVLGRVGRSVFQDAPASRWSNLFGRKGHTPAAPIDVPSPAAYAPPPTDAPRATVLEQIRQLAAARDDGLITPQEFEAKKAELLARL